MAVCLNTSRGPDENVAEGETHCETTYSLMTCLRSICLRGGHGGNLVNE